MSHKGSHHSRAQSLFAASNKSRANSMKPSELSSNARRMLKIRGLKGATAAPRFNEDNNEETQSIRANIRPNGRLNAGALRLDDCGSNYQSSRQSRAIITRSSINRLPKEASYRTGGNTTCRSNAMSLQSRVLSVALRNKL